VGTAYPPPDSGGLLLFKEGPFYNDYMGKAELSQWGPKCSSGKK